MFEKAGSTPRVTIESLRSTSALTTPTLETLRSQLHTIVSDPTPQLWDRTEIGALYGQFEAISLGDIDVSVDLAVRAMDYAALNTFFKNVDQFLKSLPPEASVATKPPVVDKDPFEELKDDLEKNIPPSVVRLRAAVVSVKGRVASPTLTPDLVATEAEIRSLIESVKKDLTDHIQTTRSTTLSRGVMSSVTAGVKADALASMYDADILSAQDLLNDLLVEWRRRVEDDVFFKDLETEMAINAVSVPTADLLTTIERVRGKREVFAASFDLDKLPDQFRAHIQSTLSRVDVWLGGVQTRLVDWLRNPANPELRQARILLNPTSGYRQLYLVGSAPFDRVQVDEVATVLASMEALRSRLTAGGVDAAVSLLTSDVVAPLEGLYTDLKRKHEDTLTAGEREVELTKEFQELERNLFELLRKTENERDTFSDFLNTQWGIIDLPGTGYLSRMEKIQTELGKDLGLDKIKKEYTARKYLHISFIMMKPFTEQPIDLKNNHDVMGTPWKDLPLSGDNIDYFLHESPYLNGEATTFRNRNVRVASMDESLGGYDLTVQESPICVVFSVQDEILAGRLKLKTDDNNDITGANYHTEQAQRGIKDYLKTTYGFDDHMVMLGLRLHRAVTLNKSHFAPEAPGIKDDLRKFYDIFTYFVNYFASNKDTFLAFHPILVWGEYPNMPPKAVHFREKLVRRIGNKQTRDQAQAWLSRPLLRLKTLRKAEEDPLDPTKLVTKAHFKAGFKTFLEAQKIGVWKNKDGKPGANFTMDDLVDVNTQMPLYALMPFAKGRSIHPEVQAKEASGDYAFMPLSEYFVTMTGVMLPFFTTFFLSSPQDALKRLEDQNSSGDSIKKIDDAFKWLSGWDEVSNQFPTLDESNKWRAKYQEWFKILDVIGTFLILRANKIDFDHVKVLNNLVLTSYLTPEGRNVVGDVSINELEELMDDLAESTVKTLEQG